MQQSYFNEQYWEKARKLYAEWNSIRKIHEQNLLWVPNVTFQNVRESISDWKEEIPHDQNAFEVENGDIVFYTKKKNTIWDPVLQRIAIPLEEIEEICKAYSRHWYNKSGTQIQQDFNLNDTAWNLVKSRIWITKDSDVIPQNILDVIEQQQGKEVVDMKIEEASHKAVVNKYKTKWVDKYWKNKERLDDTIRRAFATNESYLEHLQEYIKEYKAKEVKFLEIREINSEFKIIVISDLHFFKKGTEEIKEALRKIYIDIKNSHQQQIYIFCLGDLIETAVEGGMHPGQVESMEWVFWFDALLECSEILQQWLIAIQQIKHSVTFYGITGNHDRIAKWHDEDHQRTAWLVIYEFMKRGLNNTPIVFEYGREKWNMKQIDNFGFLIHHWDDRATGRKSSDLLMEFAVPGEHRIILMWDKHHLEMKDESNSCIRCITPALAWPWEYDERLGLSSYRGYLQIWKGWDGTPQILTVRMK